MAEKIAGNPITSAKWAIEAIGRPGKFLQIAYLGMLL